MVFAEVVTGIALVKQATDFIKSNINTINDIRDIGQQIDDLFLGEQQCQKARSKKSGNTLANQFGIESVAQEMIDAKLAQEKMQEIATLVDFRFGYGTWKSIVDERAKRIQEAKEQERLARIARNKKKEELLEVAIIIGAVIFMCAVFIGMIWIVAGGIHG